MAGGQGTFTIDFGIGATDMTVAVSVPAIATGQLVFVDFGDAPVYLNPGEFVQLCTRHIGTVGTSGTVVHRVTPVYGWE